MTRNPKGQFISTRNKFAFYWQHYWLGVLSVLVPLIVYYMVKL